MYILWRTIVKEAMRKTVLTAGLIINAIEILTCIFCKKSLLSFV